MASKFLQLSLCATRILVLRLRPSWSYPAPVKINWVGGKWAFYCEPFLLGIFGMNKMNEGSSIRQKLNVNLWCRSRKMIFDKAI